MRKFNKLCQGSLVLALSLVAGSSLADIKNVPGAACSAYSPHTNSASVNQFGFKANGSMNVYCPIVRDGSTLNSVEVYFNALSSSYGGLIGAGPSCTLYSRSVSGSSFDSAAPSNPDDASIGYFDFQMSGFNEGDVASNVLVVKCSVASGDILSSVVYDES